MRNGPSPPDLSSRMTFAFSPPLSKIVRTSSRTAVTPPPAGPFEPDALRVPPPHLEDRPDIVVQRRDSPHQAAEVVLVPESQRLRKVRSAFPGDRHAPVPSS